jgi:hypothetical protein
MVMKMEIAR